MRTRHGFAVPSRPPGAPETIIAPSKPPRKRPSASDLSMPNQVAPGFSSFPSVNNPSPAHGLPSAVQSPGIKPNKKRGRPSKAEHELRAAEAAARGEPYPPPKKVRAPKTPADQGDPTISVGAPGAGEAPGSSGAPGSRKSPPAMRELKDPQSTLEATANAANELGQSSQAVVTETQPAEQGGSESLLAGLQEHAARADKKSTETNPTEQQQPTAAVEPHPASHKEPYQTPYQQTSSV